MKFSRYNQPKRHNRRNECRQELAGMVILTQKEYEREQNAEAITPFGTFHTGADGVAVYFFSEQPTKQVNFNRSVYFI